MRSEGATFEQHKVGDVHRTLARTVSETDIVNFVNLCGFTEPLFMDMEYVKRESRLRSPGRARRADLLAQRGPRSCRPASSTAPAWPASAAS